jgi:phage baseplate assembly protein V
MSMEAALARLAGRVRLTIGRVILRAVNDAAKFQSLQVELLAEEVRENCEHFQDYGFTSHPFPDAEGLGLAVGGNRDHVVVIAVGDRRFRLKGLQQGEVAMYTDEGDKIVMQRGNKIEVTAATHVKLITPLTILTGDLDVGGNVTVDGRIDAAGDVTGQGKSLPGHTHMEQGDFSPVSPPL